MSRGRMAETPTQIPAAGWKDILLRVKNEISADHIGLIAAGVAFYGLLAVFPGIAAVMAIAGLVTDPAVVSEQLDNLAAVMPQDAADIIIGQAQEVAGGEQAGLGLAAVIGILLAIWSASAAMSSMMEGLNVAYDETEERGFVKRTMWRLLLTLGVIVGLFITVAVIVVLPILLAFFPLGDAAELAVTILRWPLVGIVAVIGLAILYRYGPSRARPQWKWVTPGALVATVLWLIGSVAFAIYVRNFGSYQETFGTLGGAVILLMWMWISAYIVLLGAELDSEMEAQTRHDTTTGAAMPMGARGAVKADALGEALGKSDDG